MRVLMVCLGNICRSPMAEAVTRGLLVEAGLDGAVGVASFGTAAYHVGEPADPRAEAALARRSWPAGRHRAAQLDLDELVRADLVCCADRANLAAVRRLGSGASTPLRLLRSFDPAAAPGSDEVPDPWHGDQSAFDDVLALIEAACRGLVASLAEGIARVG